MLCILCLSPSINDVGAQTEEGVWQPAATQAHPAGYASQVPAGVLVCICPALRVLELCLTSCGELVVQATPSRGS